MIIATVIIIALGKTRSIILMINFCNSNQLLMGGCMEEKQWIGMGLAIMGALFWGLSGTSVQFLENAKHLNVEWLLEVRLLLAGLLTILPPYTG